MLPSTWRTKTRLLYRLASDIADAGIVLSLVVIIATRTYFGEAAFNAWAWRIPFLFSFLLVFIAFYMRLQFQESPVYAEIKAKGETSKNPWREAFLTANLKCVLIATIVVLGQGVVWSAASSGRCTSCSRFPRSTG